MIITFENVEERDWFLGIVKEAMDGSDNKTDFDRALDAGDFVMDDSSYKALRACVNVKEQIQKRMWTFLHALQMIANMAQFQDETKKNGRLTTIVARDLPYHDADRFNMIVSGRMTVGCIHRQDDPRRPWATYWDLHS